MTTRRNQLQRNYLAAKDAFDAAHRGHDDELERSGLKARIDAAEDEETIERLEVEYAPICARWQRTERCHELTAAENALVDWSLDVAAVMRPKSREHIERLREHCRAHTRHDKTKGECIRLAMKLPG